MYQCKEAIKNVMLSEKNKHTEKGFTQFDKNSKHNRVILFMDIFNEYMKTKTATV